eukprot:7484898-Ditylum_brightwellii.AAC.1
MGAPIGSSEYANAFLTKKAQKMKQDATILFSTLPEPSLHSNFTHSACYNTYHTTWHLICTTPSDSPPTNPYQ